MFSPPTFWAWVRLNAPELLWDDTDRRGRMPASRRADTDVSGAISVDVFNPLHRQWCARAKKDPLDDLAYRAYRRRLRAAPKLVVGIEPKRLRPGRLPRFRPYMLSDVRSEKGECAPREWAAERVAISRCAPNPREPRYSTSEDRASPGDSSPGWPAPDA